MSYPPEVVRHRLAETFRVKGAAEITRLANQLRRLEKNPTERGIALSPDTLRRLVTHGFVDVPTALTFIGSRDRLWQERFFTCSCCGTRAGLWH